MGFPLPAPKDSLLDTPDTFAGAQRVFWSDASPWILLAAIVSTAAWRATMASPGWIDLGAALTVVVLWPLNEVVIHAFLLHFEPRRWGPLTIDLHVARLHRLHHLDPWNAPLTFIPKRTFLHVAVVLAVLGWLLAPVPAWAATALLAYFVGGLRYEWSHFLAHIRYTPSWAEELKREHRLHHFKTPERRWGVSMLAADRWLGTDR